MSNKGYDLDEFINGTMDEDARAKFEAVLEQDNELQQEAEFTAKLRKSMQQQAATPPGEFGLARLHHSIKNHEQTQLQTNDVKKSRAWKPVAIAASALLLLQSSVLVFNQSQETAVEIQTLTGPVQTTAPHLQVVFKADISLAQVQSLLQEISGNIISGPGALGIYHVQLADTNDVEAAVAALNNSNWIDSVSVR
ncbi:hypothetical protein KO507_12935 [Gilvimarinus agarilyticus]|uniref:S8 family serine peptidase n=1 Tax=unclassified Gilvimarinus TaxID=2642066 RepID=UPI001C0A109B|nr:MULTISPECIES: hypothetical protein [unclassified Gilvimarinus]MBU2886671.1 hypothetical protein [Gilvimarinus agarilyticus]MDO6571339.1 hypothetical protein [Gilvimarinus sp. 2_MG-2023]MDO6746244.1 hypothetical protein [Gilvimarinus sp. 1_MG-2023]